ncbi:MAG: adenylosuccinate lyase [Bacteroidia bacterium]|nr:adenylosuccinate lyase [Bacteroidia bacterium]MDW8134439.1 adenylosuccinate lyase [Bacteroidia bacterium]
MKAQDFWAISPLEGRYAHYVEDLRPLLSEAAFFFYRLEVELAYFQALVELPLPPLRGFPLEWLEKLKQAYQPFTKEVLEEIRTIENRTRHDVKAIEYFLREKWASMLPEEWHKALAFIHFGLTSQDINNTAQALMLRDAVKKVYIPAVEKLISTLHRLAYEWRAIPMLSFTHGQPASPTTLGKELYVFVVRLKAELSLLDELPYWTKMGGAVGNLNAHRLAFPEIDWIRFFDDFAERLGLQRFSITTQIAPYERWAEVWDCMRRLQAVLIDLAQDIWLYAHRGYLHIQRSAGQIGSSTMPHKSNPILFELAEGNLRLSNALWSFFTEKLPISRLQRDLSDSTILRNLGVAIGHGLIGIKAIREGLTEVSCAPTFLQADLIEHPEVLAEAEQILRRKDGEINAYEAVLEELEVGCFSSSVRPEDYVGYAPESVPPPQS